MRSKAYYNKFKEDMNKNNIKISINKHGYFAVTHNLQDFRRLTEKRFIGFTIMEYDYIELGENDYKLIQRIDTMNIEDLVDDNF